jgi:hypothetical protein
MSKPRYTHRDGHRTVQIRLSFDLQEAEVQWVAAQLGISESAAVVLMRKHLQQDLRNHHDWHRWCVERDSEGDKQLVMVHLDEVTEELNCFGDLTS